MLTDRPRNDHDPIAADAKFRWPRMSVHVIALLNRFGAQYRGYVGHGHTCFDPLELCPVDAVGRRE